MGKRRGNRRPLSPDRQRKQLDAGYTVEQRHGREITKARLYEVSLMPLEQGWPAVVEAINRVVEQVHPDLTVEWSDDGE